MNKPGKRSIESIIHMLVWLVLFSLPATFLIGAGKDFNEVFFHFWLQLIFFAIVFYTNYFGCVSWWFDKKRRWQYVVVNLLLIALCAWLRNYIIGELGSFEKHQRPDREPPPIGVRFYIDFLTYLIPVAFAFAIKSGKHALQLESLKKEADNIKLQAELQHLKFQLQPHFFFNALNNIYSSIDTQPGQAKAAIHSLSKLMRYLLHKSDEAKVDLAEEVEFLERYIDLMKMRLGPQTQVHTDFSSIRKGISIPPLIFISLVENAFKHGVSASVPSHISFLLAVDDDHIKFVAANTNFPKSNDDRSGSGIGLENLTKRLQLLYPGRHQFAANVNSDVFVATLVIPTHTEI